MKHELFAYVSSISEGTPVENDLPPVLVHADGLSDGFARFALSGERRGDAAKWFDRRVRVTVETIDGKE